MLLVQDIHAVCPQQTEHTLTCNTAHKSLSYVCWLYLVLQAQGHTSPTAVLPENIPSLCLFFLQFKQHQDAHGEHFRQSLPGYEVSITLLRQRQVRELHAKHSNP